MREENIFTAPVHNGRVTIPRSIRDRLKITNDDQVTFEVIKVVPRIGLLTPETEEWIVSNARKKMAEK